MKSPALIKLAVISLVVCPYLVFANAPQWKITPSKSELTFTATQNGAPVSGSFGHFQGEIYFDPTTLNKSKVHITIDMNSLTTPYSELTSTLVATDWFDAKEFPKAEFTASEFTRVGNETYQAKGTLNIRGKTVPTVLNFSFNENPKNVATVTGDTNIKRKDFGVGQGEWSSTDEVKDDVQITFKVVAEKSPA